MANTVFLFTATVFLFSLIQIGGIIGTPILTGIDGTFTPPSPPSADPLSSLTYIASNITIFFTLMAASSTFFLFGSVVIVPLTIGIFYEAAQLFRGN